MPSRMIDLPRDKVDELVFREVLDPEHTEKYESLFRHLYASLGELRSSEESGVSTGAEFLVPTPCLHPSSQQDSASGESVCSLMLFRIGDLIPFSFLLRKVRNIVFTDIYLPSDGLPSDGTIGKK